MHEQNSRYQTYLRSDEWAAKREAALDRAAHRCQVCNDDDRLQVHHRTYARLYDERPLDLTVLCGDCHALAHGKPLRSTHKSLHPAERREILASPSPMFYERVMALADRNPRFERTLTHERILVGDGTLRAYDLSLCHQAQVLTDLELARVIIMHRDYADDYCNGDPTGDHPTEDYGYVADCIRYIRSKPSIRNTALDELARRAR